MKFNYNYLIYFSAQNSWLMVRLNYKPKTTLGEKQGRCRFRSYYIIRFYFLSMPYFYSHSKFKSSLKCLVQKCDLVTIDTILKRSVILIEHKFFYTLEKIFVSKIIKNKINHDPPLNVSHSQII